jgi:hypothetical protein
LTSICVFRPSIYISGDSMSSLLYIWPLYIHGADPATSGASGVIIWHPPRTGREKVSERGRKRDAVGGGGVESLSS